MDGLLTKIGITGKLRRNFGVIVVLALSGSVIQGLPSFRFDYYDAYLKTYHLTNTQMGLFGTILGVLGIVSYLFGGIVADGLSIRKIISFSLIVTGIGGLLHLLPLSFYGLLGIYALWGISTTFAFAPACIKAVRFMTDENSQGKGFGYYEGAGSVGSAIAAIVAVWLFRVGTYRMSNEVLAMKYVIIFYSFANILMGILTYISMSGEEETMKGSMVSLRGFMEVIRHPAVWIICAISFCNHTFCLSMSYFIPYTTDILGAAVAFGATLGVLRKVGSIGGNIVGGYLVDFFGTKRMMFAAFLVTFICQVAVVLLPAQASSLTVVVVLFVIIMVFFHMSNSMAWTMMSEGAVPPEYSGTAAGLICIAGSIPGTFVSAFAGRLIDSHPGAKGFHYFFYFLIAMMAVGMILSLVWMFYVKKVELRKCDMDSDVMQDLKCKTCK